MSQKNIEAAYRLSPAQEGMLFHSLFAPESGVYVTQLALRMEHLDLAIFERCWQELVNGHPVLRTAFVWRKTREPVQVVGRRVVVPVDREDWREVPPEQWEERLQQFMADDRERGFQPAKAPLMRLSLLRLSEHAHFFVWSHHHLLLDGWSMSMLVQELAERYHALANDHRYASARRRPYGDYIRWLGAQSLDEAESYWRRTLGGFDEPVPLGIAKSVPEDGGEPSWRVESQWMSAEQTAALGAFARRSRLTLASVCHGAWALLLSRYAGASDVVFGTIVSGRPTELEGVESMVGLFINTLPTRVRRSTGDRLVPWLSGLQRRQAEQQRYEYTPLAQVQRWSDMPRGAQLFDHILVFENYPIAASAAEGANENGASAEGGLRLEHLETVEQPNYPLAVLLVPEERFMVRVIHDPEHYDRLSVRRLQRQLLALLTDMAEAEGERDLSHLSLLTRGERHQLLREWNDTVAPELPDLAIHHLFEAWAESTPDALAASFDDQHLSYGALEREANRLAHQLRALGVGRGSLVAVMLSRSLEMIPSLLGILKAGGGYVPMEPTFPDARVRFILQTLNIHCLITQGAWLTKLQALAQAGEETEEETEDLPLRAVICPEGPAAVSGEAPFRVIHRQHLAAWPEEAPACHTVPDDPAYIIFTSGSTGTPKGVVERHRPVLNLIRWVNRRCGITTTDRVLFTTSLCFDLSVYDIFGLLAAGGSIRVVSEGDLKEPQALVRWMGSRDITFWDSAPAALQRLVPFFEAPSGSHSLRQVFLSGDWIPLSLPDAVREAFPGCHVMALGGATEATVWSNHFPVATIDPAWASIPYGRPIHNARYHVLDSVLEPCPIDVPGDLYIAGICLASGYAEEPVLSATKFLADPYGPDFGGHLYRTGDRARYRPDGNLEFLGRLDHQVKIRGYRIELGEIEAVLGEHEEVRTAVVLAREDVPGDRRLVAYVVPLGEVQPGVEELRRQLLGKLPEYMVPSAFVFLPTLPVTSNGKVDRKALPAPGQERPDLASTYVAPRTAAEEVLAKIWCTVLGLDEVGINDNFFDLGGDSILSIQIVSRAGREGLRLDPRQIFEHQTVAELAAVAVSGSGAPKGPSAEQGAVTGEVPLTPIQHWFFAQGLAEPHHFNQALLFEVHRPPGEIAPRLPRALNRLLTHHDALRLRFQHGEAGWEQTLAPPSNASPFLRIDLSALPGDRRARALERSADTLQASFHLGKGPLLRLAFYDLGDDERAPARLLLAFHHLVIDAFSWRILLEDLVTLCEPSAAGKDPQLPTKTSSFKVWSKRLVEHSRSPAVLEEAGYWLAEGRENLRSLPLDFGSADSSRPPHGETLQISGWLEAETTDALLKKVPGVYRTRIQEVLLTALAFALGRHTGESRLLVHLEGHGRDELFEGVEISRTVGWFTALYPVLLELHGESPPGQALKQIKEQMRSIPGNGMGYGLLRYLAPDAEVASALERQPRAEVSFNYLGQLDQAVDSESPLAAAAESSGRSGGRHEGRDHVFDVSCSVLGGRLQLTWRYSAGWHREATVQQLVDGFLSSLSHLVEHCLAPGAGGFTPSDFPLATLDIGSLDALVAANPGLEDVYRLTSLQEGMLFHALHAPESGVYVQQCAATFEGDLDLELLRRAWQRAAERHGALRTAFFWQGLEEPCQGVLDRVELCFEVLDWRSFEASERERRLTSWLAEDRRRGFDLGVAPPMRWTLMRFGESQHHLVWSYHHLSLDGWSVSLLLREIFTDYGRLTRGEIVKLGIARPYREYVAWLAAQDAQRAEQYWRKTFGDWQASTPLRSDFRPQMEGNGDEVGQRVLRRQAHGREFDALEALARDRRLTLNSLVQGAWGVLLSRHSGEGEVVFGATGSGRPAELPGVEEMVGLFINTLPVRLAVPSEAPLMDWLVELQTRQIEQRQFEYSSLADIQGFSQVPRGEPLFDTILVFENYPLREVQEASGPQGLAISSLEAMEQTNFALMLAVSARAELALTLTYDPQRFHASTLERLLGHVLELLRGMVANPEARLGELSLLSSVERQQLLREWNGVGDLRGPEQTLPGALARWAKEVPEAVAVAFPRADGGSEALTHGELGRRAGGLAGALEELGAGPEVVVGIHLERSLEMVVALLAVLRSGAAYLPLDPGYPADRLAFMVTDSGARWIFTRDEGDLVMGSAKPLQVEDLGSSSASHRVTEPTTDFDQLAYLIYTSGSTGRPKGVGVSHGALWSFLQAMDRRLGLHRGDALPAVTPLSFDIHALELFSPLARGAQVSLLPPTLAADGTGLAGWLERTGLGAMQATPATWRLLVDAGWVGAEGFRVLCGGEALPEDLAFELRKRSAEVWNLYGPTEATVWASVQRVDEQGVHLGRALANSRRVVVDSSLRPAGVGCPGELTLAGQGLARGYHQRPALTAERFVPDPFGEIGGRLYRTGDLARVLGTGAIEFLGRLDHQVKVRGFRIELAEVEGGLRAHPGVGRAVVRVWQGAGEDVRLVAYLVASAESSDPSVELAKPKVADDVLDHHLRASLPAYMVPSIYVWLSALPLTPNGKVDRKALPAPQTQALGTAFVPAASPVEEELVQLWSQLLGVEQVGVNHDFFRLGGHSLAATRLMSRVRRSFGVEIPLRSLFEGPTVAALAQKIEGAQRVEQATIPTVSRDSDLPLSFAQQRMWFLERLQPGAATYHLPGHKILRGALDPGALATALQCLEERHETLRTTFVDSPGGEGPVQRIATEARAADRQLPLVDLSGLAPERRTLEGERLAQIEARRPFDLGRGPLLRCLLLRREAEEHDFLFNLHHIIGDEWSMDLLDRELVAAYEAIQNRQPLPLEPLEIQYADYALWQREKLLDQDFDQQSAFWRRELDDVPALLELPTDHPRPPARQGRGALVPVTLARDTTEALNHLARRRGVTLFMTLLAAFQSLLSRHARTWDVCVGSPISGRHRVEVEGLIGLFVNTLVFRGDLSGDPSFAELLSRVRSTALAAYRNQDVPFERLVDELQPERSLSHTPLFQVLFVLRNAPVAGESAEPEVHGALGGSAESVTGTAKFDLTLVLSETSQGCLGFLEYDRDLFEATTVHRLTKHLRTLIESAVAAPERALSSHDLLAPGERHQLVAEGNDTLGQRPEGSIDQAILEQAVRTPEAIALVQGPSWMSYGELHRRGVDLSQRLVGRGTGPEERIGIYLERSMELLVGLLGVLRAGGAYVPLDPELPAGRLAQMVEDAGVRRVITTGDAAERLHGLEVDRIEPIRPGIPDDERKTPLLPPVDPDQLAYVIFTSGSTGRPKGSMNAHRGVVNRLLWGQEAFALDGDSVVVQKTPMSFDVSVWELFWPLMVGARLALAEPGGHRDASYLARFMVQERVTTAHFVPSMLGAFVEVPEAEQCSTLGRVLASGEALDPSLARRFEALGLGAELHNLYGPTEAAIEVTWGPWRSGASLAPIGRPITNVSIHLLDPHLYPVPLGVAGELHIAGAAVGRGYSGRPGWTAERFVPDPFSATPGARSYRTGDLARRLVDGEIDYLGRLDHQVKVRGQRIELGEIEAVLTEEERLARVVVTVLRDGPAPRLVAYLVARQERPEIEILKRRLAARLPAVMVPTEWVFLDELPLTASGKLDRRALPKPGPAAASEVTWVAPRTPEEQALARVWGEVLHRERVGLYDNFFALGGDSILSIQVVSRMSRQGWRLTPRQLFEHQTLVELARVVSTGPSVWAEQGLVRGQVPLAPIQHWFFEHNSARPHHFNQALLFELHRELDPILLEQTVAHLLRHHDALRLRFTASAEGWLQHFGDFDGTAGSAWARVDLSALPESRRGEAVSQGSAQIQGGFSLSQGPLWRVVCLSPGPGGKDRLLLVAHHLVVDGVSWRILLEDLAGVYGRLAAGEAVDLPAKTTSYKAWAHGLVEAAAEERLVSQANLWQELLSGVEVPLPVDFERDPGLRRSTRTVTTTLDREATEVLLERVPTLYRTQVQDVLLTALARALARWSGGGSVRLDLEGHGREELAEAMDLSRTVGWFTALYPVRLEVDPEGPPGPALLAVKEQLRRIPQSGVSYGLLRHLASPEVVEPLAALPQAEVLFNYLGQLDRGVDQDSPLGLAEESTGAMIGAENDRTHLLEILAQVTGGELVLVWSYGSAAYRRETVEELAEKGLEALRELVDHCLEPDAGGVVPSDFPLADLDRGALDRWVGKGREVEDIYPLSPLQEGMLFHTLAEPESGVYVQQLRYTLVGPLDRDALRDAWQTVVNRHGILRTSVVWEGLDRPLQRVHRGVEMPFVELDWRGLGAAGPESRLAEWLESDRQSGFELECAPLLRLALIRLGEETWEVVWSHHHLLLDGWCLPLVLDEVMSLYGQLVHAGGAVGEPVVRRPYRDFIAWLAELDPEPGENFWRRNLAGLGAPTSLGVDRVARDAGSEVGRGEEEVQLSLVATEALSDFSRRRRLTLSTLCQGAWALLLGHYSGAREVLYGLTVSGRPAELAGVESMLGLFINTLPLRVPLDRSNSLGSWLGTLQERQVEMRQHEALPLTQLQAWSDIPQGTPLFESILVFENYPLGDGESEPVEEDSRTLQLVGAQVIEQTNFPLTLTFLPQARLGLRVAYQPTRLDRLTVRRLLAHLSHLLEAMASGKDPVLGALSPLAPAEQHQLLREWSESTGDGRATLRAGSTVHRGIRLQGEATPEATAVVSEDGRWLSHGELGRRVALLASQLQDHGAGPGERIGIHLERSLDMVVAVLGVLESGAAYVPLDPAYPAPRLTQMVEDSEALLVLTSEALLAQGTLEHGMALCVERVLGEGPGWSSGDISGASDSPHALAYTIFTSGSTGRPKGVDVPQGALMNFLASMAQQPGLDREDVLSAVTSLSFDIATLELFLPLLVGARVELLTSATAGDGAALARHLERSRSTVLQATPSTWLQLLDSGWPGSAKLRALCGGEALPEDLARRLAPRVSALWNLYGPTETAVWSAVLRLPSTGEVAVGRPIARTQIFLLDRQLEPVALGVPGEFIIGGAGVVRGYLGRPALSAERFVPAPWAAEPGARLYRTGDLARFRDDGTLHFLGRFDHQVKVRGHRIEIGEIETVLGRHPMVGRALVTTAPDPVAGQRLVAYVVAEKSSEGDGEVVDGWREHLREQLPEYMVPGVFIELESFPLLPNGKVNRGALPAPGAVAQGQGGGAPSTPVEARLVEIWQQVLEVSRVGVEDDFFRLGGHSLLATRVVSRVREGLGVEVPIRAIFEAPTVAALAGRIEGARREAAPVIQALPWDGSWPRRGPLSFAQQRLWFLDRLEPGRATYNLPLRYDLVGDLDGAAFGRALCALAERHQTLRTTFETLEDEPVQRISAPDKVQWTWIDLGALPMAARQREAHRLAAQEARRPFDLARGPLWRSTLLRLGPGEHELLLTLHHIIGDEWSLGVLREDLARFYQLEMASAEESVPAPSPLPVQYVDFGAWQRDYLTGEVLERAMGYWRAQLEGLPAVLELPADRPRRAVRRGFGATLPWHLSKSLLERIEALGGKNGATLFMTLLAAFQALLGRLSGQQDVAVGSPVAGRERLEVEGLIGFFVNTLVFRGDLSGNPTFEDLLARSRASALDAYTHQELPFEHLVEELEPRRSLSHTPLFQVMLVLQNAPQGEVEVDTAPAASTGSGTSKFDLTLTLQPTTRGLLGQVQFDRDLFDPTTVGRLLVGFGTLLERAVETPEAQLSQLSLLPASARHQLLMEWNDTEAAWDLERDLALWVEPWIEASPEAIAVVSEAPEDGGLETWLSYDEVDRRSAVLAARLEDSGVAVGDWVAVCVERSPELPWVGLAILRAGAGLVPLDSSMPSERLAWMVEDSHSRFLVARRSTAEGLLAPALERVQEAPELIDPDAVIDRGTMEASANHAWRKRPRPAGDHPAYLMFTSGSTGRPKGAMNSQRATVNRLLWQQEEFGLAPDDVVLQKTPVNFDVSMWELFWPLMTGCRTVLARPGGERDIRHLVAWIVRQRITTAHFIPAMFQVFLEEPEAQQCTSLLRILCGGEALAWEQRRRFAALGLRAEHHNLYGPAEAAIDVTHHPVATEVGRPVVPIGRPLTNLRIHLLDEHLEPVPIGVTGELFIGGAGLGPGYRHRPSWTAERFGPDPFAQGSNSGARLYRSGDLARHLPGGEIEFLGRRDHQVKLRGWRIEPGEIEAVLRRLSQVSQAVVGVAGEGARQRLVAHVVPAPGTASPTLDQELREILRSRLPEPMVPSAIVMLEALPLTPTGKVDRRALPAPEDEATEGADHGSFETPTENLLAGIWREVLLVGGFGRTDDFFQLGGHSILATQVVARARRLFGVEVDVRSVFEEPTLRGLAARIDERLRSGQHVEEQAIEAVPRTHEMPLSFSQQRLWVLDRLALGTAAYNVPLAVRLLGTLDVEALRFAFRLLVRRHEVMRTWFKGGDGEPTLVIAEDPFVPRPVVDLSGLSESRREAVAMDLVRRSGEATFDLSDGPLLRFRLLRMHATDHVLSITFHHTIGDGWSTAILVRELVTIYEALVTDVESGGRLVELPAMPIQYADYATWQRRVMTGEVLDHQLEWWRQHLAGSPAFLDLPTDRPRPAVHGFRGDRVRLTMSPELGPALRALEARLGITDFMVLLAAFQLLLSRLSGQDDICVGTVTAGRNRLELENLVGFFATTLVLRGDLGGSPSFEELAARTRQGVLGAYAHQDLPFEKVVEELQPERSLQYTPFFQVMFAFHNLPPMAEGRELPDLRIEGLRTSTGAAKFDLTLELSAEPQIGGILEYNTDLFDATTALRWARSLENLLWDLVADPEKPVAHLGLLAAAERHQMLQEWNDTAAPEQHEVSAVHQLFERRAAIQPQAVAAVFEGRELLYGELDRWSNQVAHHLRKLGCGRGSMVAVWLERSLEMLPTLLGILKAGAAYVPLEVTYPLARVQTIVNTQEVRCLFLGLNRGDALQELLPTVPGLEHLICLEEGETEELAAAVQGAGGGVELSTAAAVKSSPDTAPGVEVSGEDYAYVIFTSGSTGTPKGVVERHRSVLNLLSWVNETFGVGPTDRVLFITSLCFDLSVYDVFGLLAAGGSIRIAAEAEVRDPQRLLEILCHEPVTFWDSAPAALQQLVTFLPALSEEDRADAALRLVFLSGDWIPVTLPDRIRESFSGAQMVSLGGATEATVWSNVFPIETVDPSWVSIPYGRPIRNSRYHVLDARLEPVPVGVPGDLFIAGVCVASGYARDAVLSASKFLPDPWSLEPGGLLYRTGDRARYRGDGNLEFLGRLDHQVKIRGFRIELGEIESVLGEHEGVQDVVVLARAEGAEVAGPGPQGAAERRLVAYVVPLGDTTPAVAELRHAVQGKLPEYMVPSAFVFLPELPLTPNGKLDRRALPEPDRARPELAERFVGPRNSMEQKLSEIWCEVLGLDRVGVFDNFFELGGDSILSIQIIARSSRSGLRLTPRQLFEQPTVAELAAVVGTATAVEAEQGLVTGEVPLTPIQHWFFEQRLAEPWHFNQSLFLEVHEPLDPPVLEAAFAHLLTHHDALRLRFTRGPQGWRQEILGDSGTPPFAQVDLSTLPSTRHRAALEALASTTQGSLNLEHGPLTRMLFVHLGNSLSPRLLWIIHHLAVDGYSWRVLVEDLGAAYESLAQGERPQLPEKTTSIKRWAERQLAIATEPRYTAELDYWCDAGRRRELPLPVDFPRGAHTSATTRMWTASLDVENTLALIKEVPAVYHTQINEVLLTALARTLSRFTGRSACRVDLEGHGREELAEDLDVTRTVGWFTTMTPVVLDVAGARGVGDALVAVKEQMRAVPERGIGYGMLRYLRPEEEGTLAELPPAEVSFNYLGQLDQAVSGSTPFAMAEESAGRPQSARGRRTHLLGVGAFVIAGQLAVRWSYSERVYRQETIEQLAEEYLGDLLGLIEHCRTRDIAVAEDEPRDEVDLSLSNVSQQQLDGILSQLSKTKRS